jgi:hypothetical protein
MGSSLPPVVLPTALNDIGAATQQPFVIVAAGQSNMTSQDYLGSTFIDQSGGGIFVTNSWGNSTIPTAIVTAAYGSLPLNNTLAGATTTNPTLAYKSQGVQFANAARAYLNANGQASRPIVIIGDNAPAQSISDWVDQTPLDMRAVFISAIALVNAAYGTGWTINAYLWDQGENDGSGTYGTQTLYAAAFARWVTYVTGLPCWSADSRWINTELALWNAASESARNDFFRTTADGALYPFMTLTGSSGMVESLQNPPVHYDGNSQIVLGGRSFQNWRKGQMRNGYGGAKTYWGSQYSYPNNLFPTVSSAVVLGVDDIMPGAVITISGGSLQVPNPAFCFAPIYVNCLAQASLTAAGGASVLYAENSGTSTTAFTMKSGSMYMLVPSNADWFVFTIFGRIGGQLDGYANSVSSAGVGLVLGTKQWQNCWFSIDGGGVSLAGNYGQRGTFYNIAAAANSSVMTPTAGSVISMDGSVLATYPITPGSLVEFTSNLYSGTTSAMFVVTDTAVSSSGSMKTTPTTGTTVTCKTGVGMLLHVIEPAGTLAALTVALPSFPKGGNKVVIVTTQAVSALTFSNGTVSGVFSSGSATTAKQKIDLCYSVEDGAWY